MNVVGLYKIKWGAIISVFFILFFHAFIKANEGQLILDSANVAYSKSEYVKAAKLYESIANIGLESPEVYFNLGNAYYKYNNLAFAILNYERAIKLKPDNEDFYFNLKLANQKTEDKIDAAPQFFLKHWKNALVDLMSEGSWSKFLLLLIIIALILIALYFTSSRRGLKQFYFFCGTILLVICIFTFFIAQNKYNRTKNSREAIITSAAITVTGSPSEKGTKLFILHEGTKVNITQEDEAWAEIYIANGNTGWIKKSELQKI